MSLVTQADLDNASADLQTLADVINGPISPGLVMSRLGASIKTLAKAIDDISNTLNLAAIQSTVTTAAANAAAAVTAANTAQTSANTANSLLADIANDGILTPNEKPAIIREVNIINGEYAGIYTSGLAARNSALRQVYHDAYVALITLYLPLLTTPVLWSDVHGNTNISNTTFQAEFSDYYNARAALLLANTQLAAADAAAAVITAQAAQDRANNSLNQNLSNIIAKSVTTAMLADYAIDATKIKANSIFANQLVLAGSDNLVPNATSKDLTTIGLPSDAYELAGLGAVTVSAMNPSGFTRQLTSVGMNANEQRQINLTPVIPCVSGDIFGYSVLVALVGTLFSGDMNDTVYFSIQTVAANNTRINIANKTYNGTDVTATPQSGQFTIGAGVVGVQVIMTFRSGDDGGGGYQSTGAVFMANQFVLRRANTAEMVVDGSITTNKLQANAVTASKIAGDTFVSTDYTEDATDHHPTAGAKLRNVNYGVAAWQSNHTYSAGDVVKVGTRTYKCRTGGISNTGTTSNGAWSNVTAYVVGNTVTYGPNKYRCTQNHTGILPYHWRDTATAYWAPEGCTTGPYVRGLHIVDGSVIWDQMTAMATAGDGIQIGSDVLSSSWMGQHVIYSGAFSKDTTGTGFTVSIGLTPLRIFTCGTSNDWVCIEYPNGQGWSIANIFTEERVGTVAYGHRLIRDGGNPSPMPAAPPTGFSQVFARCISPSNSIIVTPADWKFAIMLVMFVGSDA
jgi:hypothetical protein